MTSPTPWTMTLQGVTVGGMECGDRSGYPVLAFHGVPGSHREAVVFGDDAAAATGLRLIAIDRPGMGASAMSPRRRIIDWIDTVTAVADRLGLDRFAVLGASGGGPYALACAYRLPDRVARAVVVSSPAPFGDGTADRGAGDVRRAGGLMVLRRFPFLARPAAARMAAVTRTPRGMAAMIARMSPTDRERIAGDDELLGKIDANMRTAFAQGSRGVAADLQVLFARPWGFELTDIAVPVVVWQGDSDGNVPVTDGRQLADNLPNSTLMIVEGAGHLLFVDHAAAILESIQANQT
ncbi:alpha/beta fold hydrolase [Nocardia sp. NPDC052566]|uniref:alpha/beta fold hydrolase n=1 Tax=Nocardia sp. NPDC052566 TaxID=3364330 RepID=UPI0037C7452D